MGADLLRRVRRWAAETGAHQDYWRIKSKGVRCSPKQPGQSSLLFIHQFDLELCLGKGIEFVLDADGPGVRKVYGDSGEQEGKGEELKMGEEMIQALFIVVNDPEKTEQVLEVLFECEMRGATVIETQGMAKVLSDHIPIFFGLRGLIANEHAHNRTIFALSKHPEKIDQAMDKLSKMFHSFEEACTGMMFVVPVLKAVGLGRKIIQDQTE